MNEFEGIKTYFISINKFFRILFYKESKDVTKHKLKIQALEPEKLLETVVIIALPKVNANIPNSYTYDGYSNKEAKSDLSNLYDELITGNFIDKRTKRMEIRKIFSNEIPLSKIIWIGNKGSLYYFISQIKSQNKILRLERSIWEVTKKLFIIEADKHYNLIKLRGQKDPVLAIKINVDYAVNCLKTIK